MRTFSFFLSFRGTDCFFRHHLLRLCLRNEELAWKLPEKLEPIWKRLYYSATPDKHRFPAEPEIRAASKGGASKSYVCTHSKLLFYRENPSDASSLPISLQMFDLARSSIPLPSNTSLKYILSLRKKSLNTFLLPEQYASSE
jgi:hypothetical protein